MASETTGKQGKKISLCNKGKKGSLSAEAGVCFWVVTTCACLTGPLSVLPVPSLTLLQMHLKKETFFFFPLSSGNPGPAQAENALSQNHLQLHKKSEKVSHPGQIAVGSSKSTDIFYVFIVFTEGMSMQIASLLVLEFAS